MAEEFRLIEEGMAPVIVERDDRSRETVDKLKYIEKIGGIAMTLQSYLVQTPKTW